MAEHLDATTDQTITGTKTFSTDPILSDGNVVPTQDGVDASLVAERAITDADLVTERATSNAAYQKRATIDVTHATYGAVGDDSTNNTTAIAAAFAAASAGDTVKFPAGTFQSDSLTLPDGVHIEGPGVLKLRSAAPVKILLTCGGGNNKINGLGIDLQGIASALGVVTNGKSWISFRGCHFTNTAVGGVYITGASTNILVQGCTFSVNGWGILTGNTSTCRHINITGNVFSGGAYGEAIEINTPTNGSSDISITSNVIENYTATGTAGFGIGLARVDRAVIVGNSVRNVGNAGIHLEDGCTNATISGNLVHASTGAGIEVTSGLTRASKNVVIIGNTVTSCAGEAESDAGILVSGTLASQRILIIGNTVADSGVSASRAALYGISLAASVTNSIVANNVVLNTNASTAGTSAGINIGGGCQEVTVSGNRCYDDQGSPTQQYGLRLAGAHSFNSIFGNNFRGNGTAEVVDTSTGSTRTAHYGSSAWFGTLTLNEGVNIATGIATGTKIGTATSQKIGFFNKTPILQPSAVTAPSGGATIDAESRTAISAILTRLQNLGLFA